MKLQWNWFAMWHQSDTSHKLEISHYCWLSCVNWSTDGSRHNFAFRSRKHLFDRKYSKYAIYIYIWNVWRSTGGRPLLRQRMCRLHKGYTPFTYTIHTSLLERTLGKRDRWDKEKKKKNKIKTIIHTQIFQFIYMDKWTKWIQVKQILMTEEIWLQAPVPLSIFRSNSKFDENSECSSFEYTRPITTIFCKRHDSDTVVTCAKYLCDRLRIFYTRVFWIFIEFRIRSKYA